MAANDQPCVLVKEGAVATALGVWGEVRRLVIWRTLAKLPDYNPYGDSAYMDAAARAEEFVRGPQLQAADPAELSKTTVSGFRATNVSED